jgi:hypothetical protein
VSSSGGPARVTPADPGAELQVRCRLYIRTGQQCLRHPKLAQHLERAGVHDQRPGGPDRFRPPVDDPDDGAVVVGLQGQGQAGRARAGHQDVGRLSHATPVRCHHPAAAPDSSCGWASSSSRRSPGSTTQWIEPRTDTSASTRHRARA